MSHRTTRAIARLRRGFTLAELLITIAIIAVLAALTIAAIGTFGAASDVRRTESTMQILVAAVDAFEKEAGRPLQWGTNDSDQPGADIFGDVPHVFSATQIFARIERSPGAKALLARVAPSQVFRYDSTDDTAPIWIDQPDPQDPNGPVGPILARSQYQAAAWDETLAVLDAWGQPIRAVHPGPDYELWRGSLDNPSTPLEEFRDEDGTVRLDEAAIGTLTGGAGNGYQSTEDTYGRATGREIFFVSAGPDGRFGNVFDDPDGFAADNIWSGPVIRPGGQDG